MNPDLLRIAHHSNELKHHLERSRAEVPESSTGTFAQSHRRMFPTAGYQCMNLKLRFPVCVNLLRVVRHDSSQKVACTRDMRRAQCRCGEAGILKAAGGPVRRHDQVAD